MKPSPRNYLFFSGLVLALLTGCQSAPVSEPPPEAASAPALPASTEYRVNSDASEIRLLVHRGGPLARFGHNHVVSGPVHGVIHAGETTKDSGFRLQIIAEELAVDKPALRADESEGFESTVSDEARQGTRNNMLGEKILDAEHHPEIRIASLSLSGPRWNPTVRARVELRAAAREVEFPAAVFEHEDRLEVIANFPIRQTAFGIEPFSVMGGGLKVEDVVEVRIRVIAERAR